MAALGGAVHVHDVSLVKKKRRSFPSIYICAQGCSAHSIHILVRMRAQTFWGGAFAGVGVACQPRAGQEAGQLQAQRLAVCSSEVRNHFTRTFCAGRGQDLGWDRTQEA